MKTPEQKQANRLKQILLIVRRLSYDNLTKLKLEIDRMHRIRGSIFTNNLDTKGRT